MKYLGEKLQQVELKDGKNMFIRNKNPKLLLVLVFAHRAILPILITRVHFHVFIAPIPQAPQHGQYMVSLLSAIIDCQLFPGKLPFSLFKISLSKNTKTSVFAQLSTGLMNLNFFCSLALDSEHTGGDTQDGRYQEESERPWERKVMSRITSWEG